MRNLIFLLLVFVPAAAWGADIPQDKEFTNSIGMKLVRIDAGEFVMGNGLEPPKSEKEWKQRDWDEAPEHRVRITRTFHMGANEVTNAQYEQFDLAHRKMRGAFNTSKNNAHYCRSANRSGRLPQDANRCTGFRVVLAEMPKTAPLPAEPPRLHAQGVKQTPAPKDGPDPSKPYFDDFKGRRPMIPANTWGPIFSKWNHLRFRHTAELRRL